VLGARRSHAAAGLLAGTGIAGYGIVLTLQGTPVFWTGLWCGWLALAGLAFRYPALGLGAYGAALYGTPRYSDLFDRLLASHLLHVLAAAVVIGTLASFRHRLRWLPMRPTLVWVLWAFGAWLLVVTLMSGDGGVQSRYGPRHAPWFFIHSMALATVAALALNRPSALWQCVMPIAAGVIVRATAQGLGGLRLEGDIGPISVMLLPLAVAVAKVERRSLVRWPAVAAALGCLGIVALTYNRGAFVALAGTLAVMAWHERRRRWMLAATLLIACGAGVWLVNSPYRARFEQAWRELTVGGSGSVTERFELWRAGFAIVGDRPFVGVGLGNYAATLDDYAPGLQGMVAHNSFVHIAAETGIPGLFLYAAIFGGALVSSGLTVRAARNASGAAIGSALQASLIGYLTAGLFISRHDMVLAYVLVGWVAALSAFHAAPSDLPADAATEDGTRETASAAV
jgi:hypothetical protein